MQKSEKEEDWRGSEGCGTDCESNRLKEQKCQKRREAEYLFVSSRAGDIKKAASVSN